MKPPRNAKRRGEVVALSTGKGQSLVLPSFFGHGRAMRGDREGKTEEASGERAERTREAEE